MMNSNRVVNIRFASLLHTSIWNCAFWQQSASEISNWLSRAVTYNVAINIFFSLFLSVICTIWCKQGRAERNLLHIPVIHQFAQMLTPI